MTRINLREYYPHYQQDCYADVPDEVAALLLELKLGEAAYRLRTYRNKAYYSLDREDGIENEILLVVLSPHEIYERKLTTKHLYAAIASLSDKQAKRIYAHFFQGLSKSDIARTERVNKSQITRSINTALAHIKKYLKNLC